MKKERFGDLDARVITPTGTAPDRGGRLVVLMHGFGAPGDDLVPLGGVLARGAPEGTRFVFPEAPIELDMMMGLMDSRAWWLIDVGRYQQAMLSGSVRNLVREVPDGLGSANQKINSLLDAVEARFQPDQLVLGGFSQGAMLACDVVLRSDRRFAGLLMMSGAFIAEDEWTPRMSKRSGLPVFQSHGRQDPLLPFFVAEHLHQTLVKEGMDAEFVPFAGGHEIPAPALEGALRFLDKVFVES